MTCSTCRYWDTKDSPIRRGKQTGNCMKMQRCFCCNSDMQPAGAIGGGNFQSFGNFSCIMWRIDSRENRKK